MRGVFPAIDRERKSPPEYTKFSQMVGRAELGDETILRRVFKTGITLFEPVEGERTGRFVFVDSTYRQILVRDRITLAEFEGWHP
jgi:hypothetical protein